MANFVPLKLPPFEDMMRQVDTVLSEKEVPIPHRPDRAREEISRRYNFPIPFVMTGLSPFKNQTPKIWEELPFHEKISEWYRTQYGNRLKGFGPLGKIVVRLGNDLWAVKIPRLIGGGIRFHAHQNISENNRSMANVVGFVEGLSPQRAAWLDEDDLQFLMNGFTYGLHASYLLEHNRRYELVWKAWGDLRTAVSALMDYGDRYGESKWASLQVTEKILKAAIKLAGGKFNQTHNLAELCEKAESYGINFTWQPLVQMVQCSPKIRYGDEKCDREQALLAHLASLQMIVGLRDGGAKFAAGLVTEPPR